MYPRAMVANEVLCEDPWLLHHVKEAIAKGAQPITEAIPLAEYLFRYDRGGFWVGASAFEYFNVPFNNFTRWWLDEFLHTQMMYTALHASGLQEIRGAGPGFVLFRGRAIRQLHR